MRSPCIDYRLEEQNSVTTIPVLEIWPHFNIPEWKEYYALYSGEMDSNSFQVSFSEAREQNEFESQSFQYITTKFDSFPSHIDCHSENRSIGVILLDVPKQTRLTETWKVGVDFGTSFTNIFINEKGGGTRQLSVENLLHLDVTKSSFDDRTTALGEYFIPDAFLPVEKPLPLATILTTRGKRNTEHKKNIFDRRIYIPNLKKFNPSEPYIETNLKWENVELTKLFLSNLCLVISALAAKEGVKNIQWSISYPSAFSRKDIKKYIKTWQDVIAQIQNDTGMIHQCPEQDDLKFFRTESLAMAQYFADKEDCNLVRSSCIDLGGGSADEAACGLVLSDTKLKGLEKKTKDPLITGETCLLNGEELSATARLEIDDDEILDISIPKIDQLLQFVDGFNSAIKDLDIEDIKPLDTYKKSKESSGLDPKYQKKLIEKTEVELKSMLLKLRNKSEDVRLDPPFILALKALLKVLAREWAGK